MKIFILLFTFVCLSFNSFASDNDVVYTCKNPKKDSTKMYVTVKKIKTKDYRSGYDRDGELVGLENFTLGTATIKYGDTVLAEDVENNKVALKIFEGSPIFIFNVSADSILEPVDFVTKDDILHSYINYYDLSERAGSFISYRKDEETIVRYYCTGKEVQK